MTEQIQLRLGGQPWVPASTVKPIKQLNFYDMPLAGILLQRRQYFLYECIEGQTADTNLWAYVPLSKREARKLRKLTGDKLTSAMQIVYDRSLVIALAVEGKIETAVRVEVAQAVSMSREELQKFALDKIDNKIERDHRAAGVLRTA